MKSKLFHIVFSCFFIVSSYAQSGFYFKDPLKEKQTIRFQLINNIIVIPIDVNGEKSSFILDTGVNKTILFAPSKKDSIHFANTSNTMIRGLGLGQSVKTITTKNNVFSINGLSSSNETAVVTFNNPLDFSGRMGITIHGIIGYSLLKNLIVEINYKHKKITFHNPKTFQYKKCKKCVTKPLTLSGKKPYIDTQISLDSLGEKLIDVKLLIDSGGSDAIWLFEDSKKDIKTPKRFFNDLLGEGISGHVYGKRSRLTKFKLGQFEIKGPTVSLLDEKSTQIARKFKARNGSIGGRILKRFKIWLDYPNYKVTFKKTGSFTSDFNYNMSGLDVVYNGMMLVRQKIPNSGSGDNKNLIASVLAYTYSFKPSYIIKDVVKGSPAHKAGILKGDIIIKINHKYFYNLKLEDIIYLFQERDKKKIKMIVKRNGEELKFNFQLKQEI